MSDKTHRDSSFKREGRKNSRFRDDLGEEALQRRIPKGTRYSTLQGASQHTVWVRDDIWLSARNLAHQRQVAIRAIIEEALWEYMWNQTRSGMHPDEAPEVERPKPF